jgi:tetratricopeptide (TPR) repeat protein
VVDRTTTRSASAAADLLAAQHPDDARLVFELAGAYDAAGDAGRAIGLYERALDGGLREPYRHRAQIQAASTLRNLGDHEQALRLLDEVDVTHPGNVAVAAFRRWSSSMPAAPEKPSPTSSTPSWTMRRTRTPPHTGVPCTRMRRSCAPG